MRAEMEILPHCQNRLFEWLTTLMMLAIACTIAGWPASISRGSFVLMLDAGLTPILVGFFFLTAGFLRIAALWANGSWPIYGPRMRSIGALAGALIWAQMMIALLRYTTITGTISIGIPVYFFLTLGELFSCYRAAFDVRHSHRA